MPDVEISIFESVTVEPKPVTNAALAYSLVVLMVPPLMVIDPPLAVVVLEPKASTDALKPYKLELLSEEVVALLTMVGVISVIAVPLFWAQKALRSWSAETVKLGDFSVLLPLASA